MNKPNFKNITDELHFSSLLDEVGNAPLTQSELAAAFIAGQIALIQRFMKEKHGLFNGEKLIGVIDDRDLERYLVEKMNEYKATAGN
jgi:hypothetical protein